MKNNLLRFLIAIFIFLNLNGCIATHIGNMSGSASLNAPNFIYKKTNVFGEAKATYFLGIGGEARQSLVLEAKKNMLNTNQLHANQALANLAVSYKTTYFFGYLIITVECIVSADIVEFGSAQPNVTETQSQIQNPTPAIPVDNIPAVAIKTDNKNNEERQTTTIKVGDNVKIVNYLIKPAEGKVIEKKNGIYTVEYKNSNNRMKKVKVYSINLEKINTP